MPEDRTAHRDAWPYPFWIGHRGAGKFAPENTLAAFRHGLAHGWRAFECDVKLSADGVPFLLHDATLDRTTNGRGVAGEHPWDALCRLDAGSWHSPAFAGEPPASLASVVAFCLANGAALNIELKPTPGREADTGHVVADMATRSWAAPADGPLFSSFSMPALQGARVAVPTCRRALLIAERWPGWLEAAAGLGCIAVALHHSLADDATLAAIAEAGMRWLPYTVNDAATAARMASLGASSVITDQLAGD